MTRQAREEAHLVACPICDAQPAQKCLHDGKRRSRPHGSRVTAARARQYGHRSHQADLIAQTLADAQASINQAHDRADQGHGSPVVVVRVDDLQDLLDHVHDLHQRFRDLDRLMVPRFMDKAQANQLLNKIAPFIRTAPIPRRNTP